MNTWSLETARLRIRPYARDDLDDLMPILGDAETMSFYERPFTREETRAWIARNIQRYEEEGLGLWALELKESDEFIGNCGPVRKTVEGRDEIELGWHVHRRLQRQGFATEAARACRDYCHIELGVARLIALVRPVNIPSARVAEKIGMTAEKEISWANMPHFVYARRTNHGR